MKREEFCDFLDHNIVLLDGATGSNLQKKGMPSGICVEQWVCEHEEALMELQRDYVEAGSQVVYASTFAANRIKLKEFGLEGQVEAINKQAVSISKKAVADKALVAGDVTMTGQQLEPLGPVKFEQLVDAYKEQMKALEQGGADFLVVETMLSLQETRAALIAAKESVRLPVMVTMSFGGDGKTLYGTDAQTAAIVLEGLGACAVGMNCSAGPDKMMEPVRQMRAVVDIPIIAKPNAGLPKLGKDGITEYDMSAEEFTKHMTALVQAGATVLGGCCGTGPDYIRALKEQVGECQTLSRPRSETKQVYITSERSTIEWNAKCKIGTIGTSQREEINEEWEDEIYDTLYDMIDDYEDEAALCICVDACQGNRAEIMHGVVKEAVSYSSVPLLFQSAYPEVLEAALRIYPGKGGILPLEGQDRKSLAAIAGKYGAILMTAL